MARRRRHRHGRVLRLVVFFTFPVLLKPLSEELSWSREAVSRAYAAMTLASAFSAPVVGHLFDRSGPRWICGPCLMVAGCAFASLALLTPKLWHLYAIFGLIGLATTGASAVVYARVISTWFDARRGLALAVMIASSGVGGIVYPPVAQALIEPVGWRSAYLILGAVTLVIGVPVILLFVRERTTASREPQSLELIECATPFRCSGEHDPAAVARSTRVEGRPALGRRA